MSYSNRKKETAMMKELRRREAADHAPRMSIVYRAVDQLKLDPANARRHSKKQIRQIAESIKTFGFNVPILIDHDGKVVAGHGRLLACRLLGMTEGADTVPRSPDGGPGARLHDRRQSAHGDCHLGRSAARSTAQGALAQRT
jgi:hypothetical protein